MALDGARNIFVSDSTNGLIKIPYVSGRPYSNSGVSLGSGFSQPQGLAVDLDGNVYVADTGNGSVKELTIASGFSTVNTLVSGLSEPHGVAIDALGNVAVSSNSSSLLALDTSTSPLLDFGTTAVNVPTADQAVVLLNYGNAELNFTAAPVFSMDSGSHKLDTTTTCPMGATGTLASGSTCTLEIYFDPTSAGYYDTGELTLTVSAVGTIIVAANQAGNAYYLPAPQVTWSIIVNPAPDFTVSASPTALTVSDGNTATTTVTVTPLNDFNAAVTLACINLPANTTCSFSPATVTPNGGLLTPEGGAASSLLTVSTEATVGSNGSHPFLPVTSLALVLGLFGIRKRRRLQMLLLVAVSIVGLGVFTGCGGVNGSSSTVTTTSVTVQATSGTAGTTGYVQHTTTFLLTVK